MTSLSLAATKVTSREERGEVDELSGVKIYTEDESVSVCVQHCMKLPPYTNRSSAFSVAGTNKQKREDKVCLKKMNIKIING